MNQHLKIGHSGAFSALHLALSPLGTPSICLLSRRRTPDHTCL